MLNATKPILLPEWTSETPPLYNPKLSWEENAKHGPQFSGPFPDRQWPAREKWVDFLGFPVASRIAVAAGPLLNAQWIDVAGKLGFDIPTYKTIRSRAHAPHPSPNVVYVQAPEQLDPTRLPSELHPATEPPESLTDLAITNSFGNPSRDPDFLMEDIARAKASLAEGQLLVVSCVGSEWPETSLMDDFVAVAQLAKAAGASVIEINFSCPNVQSQDGSLYLDPEGVYATASRVVQAVAPTPVIVKMGIFSDLEQQRRSLLAAARAGVRAVCGINTIPMRLINEDGNPTLGKQRASCGICGSPIRQAALDWVKLSRDIIDQEKLELTIIGVGGITQAEHFSDLLNAGADFASCATGMMWDGYLAARYHQQETNYS